MVSEWIKKRISPEERDRYLENGRVVEQGTHAHLLSHGEGLYARLHQMQFAGM